MLEDALVLGGMANSITVGSQLFCPNFLASTSFLSCQLSRVPEDSVP